MIMRLSLKGRYNIWQLFQLVLLFLMSLNFKNLYFYFIFASFFVCMAANFRSLRADLASFFLLVLSVSYVIFDSSARNAITTLLKQFAYPMCYLTGLNLYNGDEQKTLSESDLNRRIKVSILIVAMGTFLHYLLNASINFESLTRNTADYWTGEVVSATGQALLAVLPLGIFSAWLVGEVPTWRKWLSLIGLLVIFAYNFVLAGRTILILEVVIVSVAFIYTQRKTNLLGGIRNQMFLALVFLGVLILFLNNAFGVQEWVLDSNLIARFDTESALQDIRLNRKLIYMSRMLDFPFGGGALMASVGGHAHELYLDIYSDVGILGYAAVIAAVLTCTINVIRSTRIRPLSVETKSLLLCVFLGVNVVFFLEPILQGSPWLFCIFCYLSGVLHGL